VIDLFPLRFVLGLSDGFDDDRIVDEMMIESGNAKKNVDFCTHCVLVLVQQF
jgi:hypothetical protein